MAVEAVDGASVRGYSHLSRRSLIAMVTRRALHRVNGSASVFLFRPFVVMAARALGPGPTRLKLVKLAHNLNGHDLSVPTAAELTVIEDHTPAVQPSRRAA
jgi:hypothetical protein